jgi:ABC-type phosphate transport system substrate-binding protein
MAYNTRERSIRHDRRRALCWLAACVILGAARQASSEPSEAGAGFRVIVNAENKISSVPREFLANAFLRNVRDWADGERIQPVDLQPGSPTREEFSRRILLRSIAAIRSYWQQRIFSGRGVPPPELESDAAVVRYVVNNRGAVGYVSKSAELGAARVLAVH